MFQNHIYHNENLFRTIDLRWVIYIRITFSHDFAILQPFPQNHIQDLASKTQNLKNSIFRAMTFKIFLEINISLKSGQRYGLSIPNNDFSIGHILRSIFGFLKKSAFLYDFVGNCTSYILGTTQVSDRPISKNQYYSLLDLLK